MDDVKVWISSRRCRGKKTTYHLRWVVGGKMRSRSVGADKKRAERERAKMLSELERGTYQDTRRIAWADFVKDHVSKIEGKRNAVEAKRTLNEFGTMMNPASPKAVTYSMVEAFIVRLAGIKNKPATINKKLAYVRSAMNRAIKRGYAGRNPVDAELFKSVDDKPPRVITEAEETLLLDTAESLYGFRWWALVFTSLRTGGRRSEMLMLPWGRIRLEGDEPQVHFADTKSHRDRIVPINPDVVDVLLRLKAQTLQAGGPFIGMADNLSRQWGRIRRQAGLDDVALHDCRRTYVTRLILAGVPLPTVQKLVGHADVKTTLRYYNWVSTKDLRDGVKKLQRQVG